MLSKQANEASLAFFSFLRFLQIWSRQKQPSGDNTEASKCQNQWPCSESSGSREIVCDRWCCLLDLTECSPNIDRNASVFQSVWTRCPLIGWIWSLENEFSWLPSKKMSFFWRLVELKDPTVLNSKLWPRRTCLDEPCDQQEDRPGFCCLRFSLWKQIQLHLQIKSCR